MIAADIMRKDVVTVRDTQTVKELAALLTERRISGAPVLDTHGRLVGVVSQTDLVRRVRDEDQPHEIPAYHEDLDRWLGRRGFQVETPDFALVRDVMTPSVICAEARTPILELARCMAAKHIHRIVITDEGRVAGIVTSMDILRAFIEANGAKPAPRRASARRTARRHART